jgi:hemerythrin superfamily protein
MTRRDLNMKERKYMASDVLVLLEKDHLAAEALLNRFDDISVNERAEYFCEVVQTLVGHEVAEELVVYPTIREDAPNGGQVADARLAEQAEAEELLAEMEKLDPTSAAFAGNFQKLRDAVLGHAKAEELTAFELLKQATTVSHREELGARYQKAKASAPTHPHPHAPDTPPGNKIMGPIAAVFDRARDALHRV